MKRRKGEAMTFGDRVRDGITGFEGIVIGRCEYLNGCVQLQVKTEQLKDGATIPSAWFDIQRLELTQRQAFRVANHLALAGGPSTEPMPTLADPGQSET